MARPSESYRMGHVRNGIASLNEKIAQAERLMEKVPTFDPQAKPEFKLLEFIPQVWNVVEPAKYVNGWHVGCMAEHLEAVSLLQIKKLIINAPPRHTKSDLACVFWPAWHWHWDPSCQWIFGSYSHSLVKRDAGKAREIINARTYSERWGHRTQIRDDQNSVVNYKNVSGGYRISTTVGGTGTGEGCDICVADDPIKALDARYPLKRFLVSEWWTGTMSSRVNDPARNRKVVLQQRLDEDDLTGYLEAKDMGYEVLVLPARYEPSRVYAFLPNPRPKDSYCHTSLQRAKPELVDPRTEEGQPLWPERFGDKELTDLQKELEGNAPAQLQQRPSAGEGVIFQKAFVRLFTFELTSRGGVFVLKRPDLPDVVVLLSRCRFFQCTDTAQKEHQSSDCTSTTTAVMTPQRDLLFFDVTNFRIEVPYQMDYLKAIARGPSRWDPAAKQTFTIGTWPKPILRSFVEEAASGIGLVQGAILHGVPLVAVSARHDPIQRVSNLATMYQQGKVYHLAGAPWRTPFEDQLSSFPHAAHDDMVVSAAHCANRVIEDVLLNAGLSHIEESVEGNPEWEAYKAEQEKREREGRPMLEDDPAALQTPLGRDVAPWQRTTEEDLVEDIEEKTGQYTIKIGDEEEGFDTGETLHSRKKPLPDKNKPKKRR